MTRDPFLHVEMDTFLAMMPERYLDHPDGLSFEQSTSNGHVFTHAKTGPVAERVLSGMRRAIAEMAEAGNNLIVDDVLFGDTPSGSATALAEYRMLLQPFAFHLVGVFAPLDVLEERERARGDRMIGLSRWQYDRVHEGMIYDLEVHTENAPPEDCARLIRTAFEL